MSSSSEMPIGGGGMNSPRIQVNSLPTSLRMPPRSPSRESIATELSISGSECCWSANANSGSSSTNKLPAHLSFLKAVPESHQQLSAYLTPNRGPSPVPFPVPGGGGSSRFLKVPNSGGGGGISGARSTDGNWWEEETDLNVIKSCQALSKALGLQKSFSTGDIVSLDDSPSSDHPQGCLRACVSDVGLNSHQYQCERINPIFGMGSRSLSTWVVVGDMGAQISSQLPSPQGRPTSVHVDASKSDLAAFGGVTFTPADLILNLNKRVRQCYIRRRLLTTYKALERLSQSQFNLDQIAAVAEAEAAGNQQTVTGSDTSPATGKAPTLLPFVPADPATGLPKSALTLTDVERDQGRPLSKYMRNMMIFNWLHSLEDGQTDVL